MGKKQQEETGQSHQREKRSQYQKKIW